jgi:hypothetical protein
VFGRKQRKGDRGGSSSDDVYLGLREQALGFAEKGTASRVSAHPRVCGVVVDVPASGGFTSFVALGDDTTSLYTSVGGGTIGAGRHGLVAEATHHLLAVIDQHLEDFSAEGDDTLPTVGYVRFHVLRTTGGANADVPEDCFWGRAPHALMPVIVASHELITAIRSIEEARG